MAIVGAEHVMRWLGPKAHMTGQKFITPDELFEPACIKAGITAVDSQGVRVLNPISHLVVGGLSDR